MEKFFTEIEERFLVHKEQHRRVMHGRKWPGKIDLSSAMYMHLFDEVVGQNILNESALAATAHILHYPSVLTQKDSLLMTAAKTFNRWLKTKLEAKNIIVFNGIYGSYRTILQTNPSPVVLVPAFLHQTHKACFANCGKTVIEIPMTESGLLSTEALAKIAAQYANKHPFIYLNHNRGPLITSAYLKKIASILNKHKLYAIYDADVFYTGHNEEAKPWLPLTIPSFSKRTLMLINLTKEYGAGGLRIGFGIGPHELIEKIRASQINSLEMIPPMNAFLAEKILQTGNLNSAKKILRERMSATCTGLQNLGWKIRKPAAGINLFIDVPVSFLTAKRFHPDELFCYYVLSRTNIQLRPSGIYGDSVKTQVRLVMCQSTATTKKALKRLAANSITAKMPFDPAIEDEYAALLKEVQK